MINATRFQNTLVILWFIVCSAIVLWLGTSNKTDFDPNLTLSQALMDMTFEVSLIGVVDSFSPADANAARIIHITQSDCYCDWLSQGHQNNLDKWASENQYSTIKVNLNDHPQLAQFIPSTPAIIALDKDKQLIYVGPYSRGSGCFGSSGKIDEQLVLWDEQEDSPFKQAVVDTDARGCYCNYSA